MQLAGVPRPSQAHRHQVHHECGACRPGSRADPRACTVHEVRCAAGLACQQGQRSGSCAAGSWCALRLGRRHRRPVDRTAQGDCCSEGCYSRAVLCCAAVNAVPPGAVALSSSLFWCCLLCAAPPPLLFVATIRRMSVLRFCFTSLCLLAVFHVTVCCQQAPLSPLAALLKAAAHVSYFCALVVPCLLVYGACVRARARVPGP